MPCCGSIWRREKSARSEMAGLNGRAEPAGCARLAANSHVRNRSPISFFSMTNEMPANFGSSRTSFGTYRKTKASRFSGTQVKTARDDGELEAAVRIVPGGNMNGRPSVIGAFQWVSMVVEKPARTVNLAPFWNADTETSFQATQPQGSTFMPARSRKP